MQTEHRQGARHVIDFAHDEVPDVVALGRYEYHSVKPGLSTHRHIGAIEICYLERGRQTYRLQGREYGLVGGDIFVVPPGEAHDTSDRPEDCGVLYWLILRIPGDNTSMLSLTAQDTSAICSRLASLPSPHFAGRPAIKQIFNQLFDLHDAPKDTLKPLTIKHQLLCCLLEVINCGCNIQRRKLSPDIDRVVRKIKSDPEEEFLLSDLADEAGLSVSRFKTKFKSETGIAPREFILREKIEKAKLSLLDRRLSVTNIAMKYGFSTSQYFATVFKRFTQQSPRQFRESARSVAPGNSSWRVDRRASMFNLVL